MNCDYHKCYDLCFTCAYFPKNDEIEDPLDSGSRNLVDGGIRGNAHVWRRFIYEW